MAQKFSLSNFFGMNADEYDDGYEEPVEAVKPQAPVQEPVANRTPRHNNKVVSIKGAKSATSQIQIFEPRMYSDVKKIAAQLLANEAAVVNFTRVDQAQAKRIVDFLTGTIFAIDGDIQRVGDQIFLCTPNNFEVSGSLDNDESQFN